MKFKILVSTSAQNELEEVTFYYKNRVSLKVANKFRNTISNVYETLSLNPFFQRKINNYRAIPIKKFPYLIFFEINEDQKEVKILAIFNTNQNPEKYPE